MTKKLSGTDHLQDQASQSKASLLFIVYSQAIDEEITEAMREFKVSGYTKWTNVQGEGGGEPHLGNNIWPSVNNCLMVALPTELCEPLAQALKEIKSLYTGIGVQIFWTVLQGML